jgi:hypothetical protein
MTKWTLFGKIVSSPLMAILGQDGVITTYPINKLKVTFDQAVLPQF